MHDEENLGNSQHYQISRILKCTLDDIIALMGGGATYRLARGAWAESREVQSTMLREPR